MIQMVDGSKDIFATAMAWRLNVQGLFLHGGRHHFNIGTNNTDCSFHAYTDCTFSNASGAAIRLRPPADFPYYHGSGSTQVTFRDSKFFNNEQVAVFFGDTMTIEDVWVEGSGHNQSAFKALFENHAKLVLNRACSGCPTRRRASANAGSTTGATSLRATAASVETAVA
jgi:hypothetical protein